MDAAELEQPRRHHYEFAHIVLRQICTAFPAQFFAIVASDERQRFMDWIWKSVEEHAGAPANGMSAADLDLCTGRLGGFPAILVGMPPPRATAEAHAVALVLTGMDGQPPADDEKPASAISHSKPAGCPMAHRARYSANGRMARI